MLEKKCRKCEITKDIKEFSISRSSKDGYQNKCKVCVNIYNKKYREENKDYYKKKNKEWKEDNKNKIKEYSKVYYDENRHRILEYTKKYREENKDYYKKKNKEYKEENKDRLREWREENKDRLSEYSREYRENNKELTLEYSRKYYEENKIDINKRKCVYHQKNKDRIRIVRREYNRKRILNDPLYKLKVRMRTLILNSLKDGGYTKYSKSIDILGCSYEELLDHLSDNKYGFIYGDDNLDIDHIIPLSRATSEEEIIKLNHYTNLQLLPSEYNRYIKIDKDFDSECLEEWLLNKK